MRDSADRPATAPARGRGRSAIVTLPDHIGVANVDPLRMHQVMCWEGSGFPGGRSGLTGANRG
ncbi:MAG TPA: hypothetical protein VEF71_27800 [Streptosporangiaceae bacterium]|nr:hypothetical protein [Streptosporangiaceae bacterium]